MSLFTANLQLSPLPNLKPENLLGLAESLKHKKINTSLLIQQIKLQRNNHHRLIDEIMVDVEAEEFNHISLIEWVYCLSAKSRWDKLYPEKSLITSEKIWQFAQQYQPLKKRLFWYLVKFSFDQNEQTLAPSLAESFIHFQSDNKDDYIIVKTINLLIAKNYLDLALICLNQCLQPDQLLSHYGLPHELKVADNLSLVKVIQSHFPQALNKISTPESKQINFLINTLESLAPEYQLTAVEKLLQHINPQVASNYPKLISWVKNNYILTSNKNTEKQLSNSSQLLFKKWISAVHYKDFAQFIDLIIDRISLDSLEDYQLMTRKVFWSNYSDRLMRMRIMLPFSTIQAFGTDFDVEDITQLINDGSESTEVCILDLEDIFVVEFFRGVGCETRIFAHNSSVEEQLFYSPEICLKRLRYLSVETDEVIDHCYGWQIQLEQVLRSKNIFPNQHQQHFNLEENKQGLNYSKTVGLPTLNSRQMMQRNKELFNWQNDIIRLETEAQKYCQRQEQRGEFDSRFIFKSNSSSRPQKRSHLDFID